MAYTREDVVEAGLLRFRRGNINNQDLTALETMFYNHYDEVGKDEFRKNASVDAEAMKIYFESKK